MLSPMVSWVTMETLSLAAVTHGGGREGETQKQRKSQGKTEVCVGGGQKRTQRGAERTREKEGEKKIRRNRYGERKRTKRKRRADPTSLTPDPLWQPG